MKGIGLVLASRQLTVDSLQVEVGSAFTKKTPEIGDLRRFYGGEGGIRTPDALASISVFETDAFSRSATSPGARGGDTVAEQPPPASTGQPAIAAFTSSQWTLGSTLGQTAFKRPSGPMRKLLRLGYLPPAGRVP